MKRESQPWGPDTKRSSGPGEGNLNRQSHGHRAAATALQRGEPFRGIALAKENEIRERWFTDGILSIVEDNTVKLQTVYELYEACVMSKLNPDDVENIEHTFDRFIMWGTKINNELMRLYELARARDQGAIDYEKILEKERAE